VATWDRYLGEDADSAWAEEARRHRQRLLDRASAPPEETASVQEEELLAELIREDGPGLERIKAEALAYEQRFHDPWLVRLVRRLAESPSGERDRLREVVADYGEVRISKRADDTASCLQRSERVVRDPTPVAEEIRLPLLLARGGCAYMVGDYELATGAGLEVERRAAELGMPLLAGQGAWLAALVAHEQRRVGE